MINYVAFSSEPKQMNIIKDNKVVVSNSRNILPGVKCLLMVFNKYQTIKQTRFSP